MATTPKITDVTLTEFNTSITALGITDKFVLDYSSILFTVTVENYSSNGFEIYINDNYYFTTKNTAFSIIPYLSDGFVEGTNTFELRIIDGENTVISSFTGTFEVLGYYEPTITNFNIIRCNSDGEEDNEGECAKIEVQADICELEECNSKNFEIKYKKVTDDSYTTLYTYNDDYSLSETLQFDGFDIDYTYEFILYANDAMTGTTSIGFIYASFSLLDFKSDGTAIAVGKTSVLSNSIELGLDTYVYKDLFIYDETYGNKISLVGGDWVDVTTTVGDWYYLKYRQIGKQVFVSGMIYEISYSSSTTQVTENFSFPTINNGDSSSPILTFFSGDGKYLIQFNFVNSYLYLRKVIKISDGSTYTGTISDVYIQFDYLTDN